jgi:hypothetical protein
VKELTTERLILRAFTADDAEDMHRLAVALRDSGQVIGACGLQFYLADFIRTREAPGSPFNAVEAGRAVIAHAFADLRLPRQMNGANKANLPSINLMKRLGFRIEGTTTPPGQTRSCGFWTTVSGRVENEGPGRRQPGSLSAHASIRVPRPVGPIRPR